MPLINHNKIKKVVIAWLVVVLCSTVSLLFLSNSLIAWSIVTVLLCERVCLLVSAVNYKSQEVNREQNLHMQNISLSKENWDLRRDVDAINRAYSQAISNNGRAQR